MWISEPHRVEHSSQVLARMRSGAGFVSGASTMQALKAHWPVQTVNIYTIGDLPSFRRCGAIALTPHCEIARIPDDILFGKLDL